LGISLSSDWSQVELSGISCSEGETIYVSELKATLVPDPDDPNAEMTVTIPGSWTLQAGSAKVPVSIPWSSFPRWVASFDAYGTKANGGSVSASVPLSPVEIDFKLEHQGPPGPTEVRNYVQENSRLQSGTKPDLRSDITIGVKPEFDLGTITTSRGTVDTLNPASGLCGADGKFKTTLSTREKAPVLKVKFKVFKSPDHNMLPALYKNQFHLTGYYTPSEADARWTGPKVTNTTVRIARNTPDEQLYTITSPRAAKRDFLRSLAIEGEGFLDDNTHVISQNVTTPGTSNPIETTSTIVIDNGQPKGTRNRNLVVDSSCAITRDPSNGVVIPDAATLHIVGQAGEWSAIDRVKLINSAGGHYHIDLYKGTDRAAAEGINTDADVILVDY
jgi:hypothetical protein